MTSLNQGNVSIIFLIMNSRMPSSKVLFFNFGGKSDGNSNIPSDSSIIVSLDSKDASWHLFLLVVFVQTKLESIEIAFSEKMYFCLCY